MKTTLTLCFVAGLAFSQSAPNASTIVYPSAQSQNRLVLSGKNICGPSVDAAFGDVIVTNTLATDTVTLARWLDPRPTATVHTALVLEDSNLCVVQDGQVVDGRMIVRILPTSVVLSNDDAVAYEALYLPANAQGQVRRGAFLTSLDSPPRFLFDINPATASAQDRASVTEAERDYGFDASGQLIPKQGIMLSAQPQGKGKLLSIPGAKSTGCDGKPLTVRQRLGLDLPKGGCGGSNK